jgi:hypothetical protein
MMQSLGHQSGLICSFYVYDLHVISIINVFQKRFHGKGTVEFEDGSFMMGYWLHGIKQGHFKVNSVGSVSSGIKACSHWLTGAA